MNIHEIARTRKSIEELRERIAQAQAALDATPEAQELKALNEQKSQVLTALNTLEGLYRTDCVALFKETGEKKYLGGQIKMYTDIVYDPDIAVAWAIEHKHAGLLSLNKNAFNKVAKELTPEFVTITEDPRMTLATDLSEFI